MEGQDIVGVAFELGSNPLVGTQVLVLRCCSYSCIMERSNRSGPEMGAAWIFLRQYVSRLLFVFLRYASLRIRTRLVKRCRNFSSKC